MTRLANLTGLSAAQLRAHSKLSLTEWHSPHKLQEERGTLDALVQLGLAKRRDDLGSASFPKTEVKYLLAVACDECLSRAPRAERCDEPCPACGRQLFCDDEDAAAAARCEARSL